MLSHPAAQAGFDLVILPQPSRVLGLQVFATKPGLQLPVLIVYVFNLAREEENHSWNWLHQICIPVIPPDCCNNTCPLFHLTDIKWYPNAFCVRIKYFLVPFPCQTLCKAVKVLPREARHGFSTLGSLHSRREVNFVNLWMAQGHTGGSGAPLTWGNGAAWERWCLTLVLKDE